MSAASPTSPMTSVYAGQRCIGFVLRRGHTGYEAYDADLESLGKFSTQREAADAVSARGSA
jgi:hypothetical protein